MESEGVKGGVCSWAVSQCGNWDAVPLGTSRRHRERILQSWRPRGGESWGIYPPKFCLLLRTVTPGSVCSQYFLPADLICLYKSLRQRDAGVYVPRGHRNSTNRTCFTRIENKSLDWSRCDSWILCQLGWVMAQIFGQTLFEKVLRQCFFG